MNENSLNLFQRIWNFYFSGFRNMSGCGRQLWIIILIKLFIIFAILKVFFFPNFLNNNFKTEQERIDYVLEILTEPKD